MVGGLEPGSIATLAFEPAAERDADQIAFEIIAPLMIDADVSGGVAAHFSAYQCAAMGAAIYKGMDRAVASAGDHDRSVADKVRLEVSRIGYFAFEYNVVPDRAAKQAALLHFVDFLIIEELVRHAGDPRRVPSQVR